jgi:hypothetical protein
MNWGKGIIIGMGLFMGFIIFLVVNLMMHKVDLVSEDYYKNEINYEAELSALRNNNQLTYQITLESQKDFVVVKIPDESEFSNVQLFLSRPDNKKLDKFYTIQGTKTFLIPKKELIKGIYNVEVRFDSSQKKCLKKDKIYI